MSQAGTQGSDDMVIFGQSTKEEASSAVEQIPENPESLGILGNAAAQEISTLPPISSREATVIVPRADGKGGVIDLSAVRREQQVQQMQAELLESIRPQAAPVESIPVTPQPEISPAPTATEEIRVQDPIGKLTAEIRQLQKSRQPASEAPVVVETSAKQTPILNLFGRLFKSSDNEPVSLFNERQAKKKAA